MDTCFVSFRFVLYKSPMHNGVVFLVSSCRTPCWLVRWFWRSPVGSLLLDGPPLPLMAGDGPFSSTTRGSVSFSRSFISTYAFVPNSTKPTRFYTALQPTVTKKILRLFLVFGRMTATFIRIQFQYTTMRTIIVLVQPIRNK